MMPDALLAGLSVERRAANCRAMLAEPQRSALTFVVEHLLDGMIGLKGFHLTQRGEQDA